MAEATHHPAVTKVVVELPGGRRRLMAMADVSAIRALRELAKTAEDGYCGIAAYECSDRETEIAEMVAMLTEKTADRLEQEANAANKICPYTFAHTRHWCGNDG